MVNTSLKAGWKGYLSFTFVKRPDKTVVKDKQHFGPLVLQRPYYQEPERPTVLIIHPPGGIAGGDELSIEINAQEGSQAIVSTPAATKFYRSNEQWAKQTQTITLKAKTEMEWLPQETLFFNQSFAQNELVFNLENDSAKLIAWDIVGLGRPARAERFDVGELKQSLKLTVAGRLKLLDRQILRIENDFLNGLPALANHHLLATMVVVSKADALNTLKEAWQSQTWLTDSIGVTLVNDVLVLRLLASDLEDVKHILFQAWSIARPIVMGKPVEKPRIWNT